MSILSNFTNFNFQLTLDWDWLVPYGLFVGYGATFLAHTGILRGKQQDPLYQSTIFLVLLRFCILLF